MSVNLFITFRPKYVTHMIFIFQRYQKITSSDLSTSLCRSLLILLLFVPSCI